MKAVMDDGHPNIITTSNGSDICYTTPALITLECSKPWRGAQFSVDLVGGWSPSAHVAVQ